MRFRGGKLKGKDGTVGRSREGCLVWQKVSRHKENNSGNLLPHHRSSLNELVRGGRIWGWRKRTSGLSKASENSNVEMGDLEQGQLRVAEKHDEKGGDLSVSLWALGWKKIMVLLIQEELPAIKENEGGGDRGREKGLTMLRGGEVSP